MKNIFKRIPLKELAKFFAAGGYPYGTVQNPFGTVDSQTPAYAATLAVTINQQVTFLKLTGFTGNMTINLTVPAEIRVGAQLNIEVVSDANARTITFGTGFLAPNLVTVASKTHSQEFYYDGTQFVAVAAQVQLN